MSLLLDALKRAEQEKLARGGASPPAAPAPHARAANTLHGVPAAGAANLELQPIGAPAPHTLGVAPRHDPAAHAANVVFQAKAPPSPEPRNRGMVWATLGAVAVVAIAAGAYVWFAVNSLTPQMAAQARPRPLPPPVGPLPIAPPPESLATSPIAALAAAPVASPPPATVATAPATSAPREPAEDAIARLVRESAAATPAAEPLRLDRSADSAREVAPQVQSGYEALRQGNIAAARRSYEAAIASDPANVDARLGLATVEARTGNRSAAAVHYRRVLDGDPRNATAMAGLAALADFSRPEAIEAQLRADLEQNPRSGALHLTLGNVYAAQGRWHEAQAELFEAHRLDPGSADILYNLAVSLDNLGQARLAEGFYRRALETATQHGAQFDPAPVARRLAEMR